MPFWQPMRSATATPWQQTSRWRFALLATAAVVIDARIEEHGGRIFNTAGDSVLAEFLGPSEAVRCGLAVQEALHGADSELPLLTFRIGIALGEVVVDGANLLGATVNIAARLEAIAPAGGLCISGAVHDAIAESMGKTGRISAFAISRTWSSRSVSFASREAAPARSRWWPRPERPLIIVLPFTNPGGLAEESYLSEGITEDVIAGLSRFGRLAVLGTTSSDVYRDRSSDLSNLVTELGVDYAVRGSVRRAGNTVRLSAQLVDARSGLTLWAERYDRVIENLFAAQDEISATIVSTLAGQLEDEAAAAASRKRTENMEAYDFLLRGIHMARALDPPSAAAALALFEKALALDPNYALALAWFALMKLRLWAWRPGLTRSGRNAWAGTAGPGDRPFGKLVPPRLRPDHDVSRAARRGRAAPSACL